MSHPSWRAAALSAALGITVAAAAPAAAQSDPPPDTVSPTTRDYVTREEYERLRSELDAVRRRVDEAPAPATTSPADTVAGGPGAPGAPESRKSGGSMFDADRFVVTGYAAAGFTDRHAGHSSFSAKLNPIFLWNVSDRIFVDAQVELTLTNEEEEGTTDVGLEYAAINFIVNDYATVRVGKFLTPFGQFPERLHPEWINKLPDFPLVYTEDGGLVPFGSVGAEVRGAVPFHPNGADSKLVYAAYVANGPSLLTGPDNAGTITDTNFDDNNSNKAVGGRVGYLPFPELEVGYSILYGDVLDGTTAVIQGVDASYRREVGAIRGSVEARAEWVWSNIETATFADAAPGGGPLTFSNKRNGGYVQLAYRPTQADARVLRDLEFVARYDELHTPAAAPGLVSARRVTLGVDYWVASNVVLKAAFRLDDPSHGQHDNALLLQAAVSF